MTIYFSSKIFQFHKLIIISHDIPKLSQIVIQYIFTFIISDFLYYFSHKYSHILNISFHRKHHEFANNFSFLGYYKHPLEHVWDTFLFQLGL